MAEDRSLYCSVCWRIYPDPEKDGVSIGSQCATKDCLGIVAMIPDFTTLVTQEPGFFVCPRSIVRTRGGVSQERPRHFWQKFRTNGNRVCSACGSLHPDDFAFMVWEAANAPEDGPWCATAEILPSDKPYKIYVRQAGVRNAMEGGIKFYTHHLSERKAKQIEGDYREAVRRSDIRSEANLKAMSQERLERITSESDGEADV